MSTSTTSPAGQLERCLADMPAVDIALLAGGRVADLGCGAGATTVAIARAYPEALVDGFELDGAAIDMARAAARRARLTGRVAFRCADVERLRPGDVPRYDVVVAPARLQEAARRLAGDHGTVVTREGS